MRQIGTISVSIGWSSSESSRSVTTGSPGKVCSTPPSIDATVVRYATGPARCSSDVPEAEAEAAASVNSARQNASSGPHASSSTRSGATANTI